MKEIFSSLFRQINDTFWKYKMLKVECDSLYEYLMSCYDDYVKRCADYYVQPGEPAGLGSLERLKLESDIPTWLSGYYATLEQMMTVWDHNDTDNDFLIGFLAKTRRDIQVIQSRNQQMLAYRKAVCSFLMREGETDLLGLLTSLYAKAARQEGIEGAGTVSLQRMIQDILTQLEGHDYARMDFYAARKHEVEQHVAETQRMCAAQEEMTGEDGTSSQELRNSLGQILAYAECRKELADSFYQHVEAYREMPNKSGTEDDVRRLREQISQEFYEVYQAAFYSSLKKGEVPVILRMFFEFGYVDEELAGAENARYLYQLAERLPTDPENGVYSFYEWLHAIYTGKKEPSRNEFDMDYGEYLRSQKKTGKLTDRDVEALLNSRMDKVKYELENVFASVNKVTYGKISVFCPVFSAHNVTRALEEMLVSADELKKIIQTIRKRDFGAYYRETLYSKPEIGIPKAFINIEILPDVILTPNVGTRGILWQEIEGKSRTTPARMMSSIFQQENLTMILVRLTGEFRWEMCKRVQGARWNDISERSLTSEYFDYIQFYRKNQELSTDAKEKIKSEMARAKNSFKEMFVRDYMTWILFESGGNPRMNKVARRILFTYCPFCAEVREKLKENPLYREIVERYEIRVKQKQHQMNNMCQKLRAQGVMVPYELEAEAKFIAM